MSDAAAFIARWAASSGSEKANHQLFVAELCDLLGVPRPDPVVKDGDNAYAFEKQVELRDDAGGTSSGWIDCYRRGCFVLEAKQATADGPNRRGTPAHQGRLLRARKQAEGYVRALDPAHEPPVPFLIVLDVGGSFDLYADFTRTNRFWSAFPDATRNRIRLAELAEPAVRERLALLWRDPYALDPATRAQVVTRDAAERLAVIARELEAAGHTPERVAGFLMRYFFCAFAEDVGLMRRRQFTEFLAGFRGKATHLAPALETLWGELDRGGFSQALRADVLRFNGGLFAESYALPVDEAQLALLVATAELDWSPVEPAIFGTLLERALDPVERHRLGAHYTPRAYVDRLVSATLVEPLRAMWRQVQDVVEALLEGERGAGPAAEALIADLGGEARKAPKSKSKSDAAQLAAQRLVAAFHRHLAGVRVLDPACGSGNFLYVALEHLKRLEGEVLSLESRLGAAGSRIAMGGLDIDPRNVLGLELNPRAARIAELVLWIGYLQWYRRTHGGEVAHWPDPVLHAYNNIQCRDALIAHAGSRDTGESRWDGRTTRVHPVTGEAVPDERARMAVVAYDAVIPAPWPEADYIVGNPPFIGGGAMRQSLGVGYVNAIRTVWQEVPESADFVMYWWYRAAELTIAHKVKRFGFITTKSIGQTFNRRVVSAAMGKGLKLAYVVPNHPWVDSVGGAAVRIALTVGDMSSTNGTLMEVVRESSSGDEIPVIEYIAYHGHINEELRLGVAYTSVAPLIANSALANTGVKLHGAGFIVTLSEAKDLGYGTEVGIDAVIKPYLNGKDVNAKSRAVLVIDCNGLTQEQLRLRFPKIYQRLYDLVKPERDLNNEKYRRENWWLFGRNNAEMRSALSAIGRYIATTETSKHRVFVFLDRSILPDNMLIAIGCDDALVLGVLSSRLHVVWSVVRGGKLGVGNDPRYNKSVCFDPFPFPACTPAQQALIRQLGEDLDAHRKRQQAAHPGLTLTGMYNVLAKLRSGEALTAKEKTIHEQGLCSVLKDLHDRLDAAVAAAYGWPVDLPDDDLLARLVALNAERAAEEARGTIRWLRPEYQQRVVKTAKAAKAAPGGATGGRAGRAPRLSGSGAPRPSRP